MKTITLNTPIRTSVARAFELSRDIDFHKASMQQSSEKVIAGCTSGKINLDETVTFQGKHFGLWLTHKSKIAQMTIPTSFTDVMVEGNFKHFEHRHIFQKTEDGVLMTDIVKYKLPFGFLGKIVGQFVMHSYLTRLLQKRNKELKKELESDMKFTFD